MSNNNQECDNKINVPDAGQPIVFFIVATLIFGYIRYTQNTIPIDIEFFNNPTNIENIGKNNLITILIYVMLLIIGNYFINLNISKEICGGNIQWFATFLITVLPWILMFVTIIVILNMFPGWLSPFSNTIGYIFANLTGLNELMDEILRPQSEVETGTDLSQNKDEALIQYNLNQIYGDKSLLINEISTDNFEIFWNRFEKAQLLNTKKIAEESSKNNVFLKNELFNYIVFKNTIAEVIWYILTGILVTSVSYNYMVNNACKRSAKQMEDTHNAYLQLQEKLNKNNSNHTKYTVG
jgi:hypothetical protein